MLRRSTFLLVMLAGLTFGEQKPEKNKVSVSIIGGTVFRAPGFSFPSVEVLLEPAPEGKTSIKVKKMKAFTDSRGEYSFRVPPKPMRYNLTFQAKGHAKETKQVTVSGEERQDVFVTLKAIKEGVQ